MTNAHWIKKQNKSSSEVIHYYSKIFDLHPITIQLLLNKGYKEENEISTFLYPSSHSLLDPFLLPDMKKSVMRIIKAIKNGEKIMIFGDYDVDGISSTTLLYKTLKLFKADVHYKLPLRSEGYGISPEAVEEMKHKFQPGLIITVDNGSTAYPALKRAKELGIDVIVTDHHELGDKFPDCYSFINPKRRDKLFESTP